MGTNGVEHAQGPAPGFPSTACSLIIHLPEGDPRRLESIGRLFTMYHGAILAHLRRTWRKLPFEEIEDRASAFYASLLEKDAFRGFDTTKSRFRTFLKMLLDRFARDMHDKATALRRGGGVQHRPYSGDLDTLKKQIEDHDSLTPEEILDEVAGASFLDAAVERTRAWADSTGRAKQFEAFRLYSLEPEEGRTYRSVAERIGVKESDVRNYIHGMREHLKQDLQDILKPTVADPERDVPEEFQDLYGRRRATREA